jgi:hypothetical protein
MDEPAEPLPTLLSQAFVAWTIEVDNLVEAAVPHGTTGDRRAGEAPGRVLPHFPLVLHRGGWPDGA